LYLFHIIENKLFLLEISVWYKTVFVKWIFMLSCQLLTFITCILSPVYNLPQSIHWIHWWTVCDHWYHHYPSEVLSVQRFSTWKCGVFESENNNNIDVCNGAIGGKQSFTEFIGEQFVIVWLGQEVDLLRMEECIVFLRLFVPNRWGIKNVLSIVCQIYS